LTYAILFLVYSMASVPSGTTCPMKQLERIKGAVQVPSRFSMRYPAFGSPYIKAPILPTLLSIMLTYRGAHCATLPVTAHTRSLMLIFSLPVLFIFPPNLVAHSMPHVIVLSPSVVLFHCGSRKQTSSQDPLFHLIRRHLVKSETVLRPPQSLYPPYRLTSVHVPHMRYHQTFPRPLRCLIL
jgi:hypothetical protein